MSKPVCNVHKLQVLNFNQATCSKNVVQDDKTRKWEGKENRSMLKKHVSPTEGRPQQTPLIINSTWNVHVLKPKCKTKINSELPKLRTQENKHTKKKFTKTHINANFILETLRLFNNAKNKCRERLKEDNMKKINENKDLHQTSFIYIENECNKPKKINKHFKDVEVLFSRKNAMKNGVGKNIASHDEMCGFTKRIRNVDTYNTYMLCQQQRSNISRPSGDRKTRSRNTLTRKTNAYTDMRTHHAASACQVTKKKPHQGPPRRQQFKLLTFPNHSSSIVCRRKPTSSTDVCEGVSSAMRCITNTATQASFKPEILSCPCHNCDLCLKQSAAKYPKISKSTILPYCQCPIQKHTQQTMTQDKNTLKERGNDLSKHGEIPYERCFKSRVLRKTFVIPTTCEGSEEQEYSKNELKPSGDYALNTTKEHGNDFAKHDEKTREKCIKPRARVLRNIFAIPTDCECSEQREYYQKPFKKFLKCFFGVKNKIKDSKLTNAPGANNLCKLRSPAVPTPQLKNCDPLNQFSDNFQKPLSPDALVESKTKVTCTEQNKIFNLTCFQPRIISNLEGCKCVVSFKGEATDLHKLISQKSQTSCDVMIDTSGEVANSKSKATCMECHKIFYEKYSKPHVTSDLDGCKCAAVSFQREANDLHKWISQKSQTSCDEIIDVTSGLAQIKTKAACTECNKITHEKCLKPRALSNFDGCTCAAVSFKRETKESYPPREKRLLKPISQKSQKLCKVTADASCGVAESNTKATCKTHEKCPQPLKLSIAASFHNKTKDSNVKSNAPCTEYLHEPIFQKYQTSCNVMDTPSEVVESRTKDTCTEHDKILHEKCFKRSALPNVDACTSSAVTCAKPQAILESVVIPCHDQKHVLSARDCLKYFLFAIILLIWSPFIVIVLLCWLLTYPLRTSCWAKKHGTYRERLEDHYQCAVCKKRRPFGKTFCNWVKDANGQYYGMSSILSLVQERPPERPKYTSCKFPIHKRTYKHNIQNAECRELVIQPDDMKCQTEEEKNLVGIVITNQPAPRYAHTQTYTGIDIKLSPYNAPENVPSCGHNQNKCFLCGNKKSKFSPCGEIKDKASFCGNAKSKFPLSDKKDKSSACGEGKIRSFPYADKKGKLYFCSDSKSTCCLCGNNRSKSLPRDKNAQCIDKTTKCVCSDKRSKKRTSSACEDIKRKCCLCGKNKSKSSMHGDENEKSCENKKSTPSPLCDKKSKYSCDDQNIIVCACGDYKRESLKCDEIKWRSSPCGDKKSKRCLCSDNISKSPLHEDKRGRCSCYEKKSKYRACTDNRSKSYPRDYEQGASSLCGEKKSKHCTSDFHTRDGNEGKYSPCGNKKSKSCPCGDHRSKYFSRDDEKDKSSQTGNKKKSKHCTCGKNAPSCDEIKKKYVCEYINGKYCSRGDHKSNVPPRDSKKCKFSPCDDKKKTKCCTCGKSKSPSRCDNKRKTSPCGKKTKKCCESGDHKRKSSPCADTRNKPTKRKHKSTCVTDENITKCCVESQPTRCLQKSTPIINCFRTLRKTVGDVEAQMIEVPPDCEDLYLQTLKRKPCFFLYKYCPNLYPYILAICDCYSSFIRVVLYALMTCIWFPTFFCFYICWELLGCCFCF